MLLTALGGVVVVLALPYLGYIFGYYLVDTDGHRADTNVEHTTSDAETPPVSVVLPTYNEAALIESKLRRLVEANYPAEALELLVADDSTDETPALARAFDDETAATVRVIKGDGRRGVATAVNDAVAAASHEIIFRTDCDAKLGEDAIGHAVARLQQDGIGAVTGQQTTVVGGSELEQEYRGLQARNQAFESALDSTFIVHGPCFAFCRSSFQPIPEDSLADDTAIAVAIRKAGERVVFDPAMTFAEASTSHVRERRTRKDRRAMGLLQLLARHTDMLGRYGWYGRLILPANWWFLVVSPWVGLLVVLVGTAYGLVSAGPVALAVPGGLVAAVALGHRDLLGPLQPAYAVLDAHVSSILAAVRLVGGTHDGTWTVDDESREQLEE